MSKEQRELTPASFIAYVRERGHVSFAELVRDFDGARGDLSMEFPRKNIVLWAGLSPLAIDVLEAPETKQAVEMLPAHFLVYLVDGAWPTLPIAKRNHAYKKPHWMPVVFNARRKAA